MTLYNCKAVAGTDQYVITKFTDEMDVESSYITSRDACDCPAGSRPTCRHRQMIPRFIARGGDLGEWFLDFDAGKFIRAEAEVEFEAELDATGDSDPEPESIDATGDQGLPAEALAELAQIPGVEVYTFTGDPVDLHNAIADAVGEPRLETKASVDPDPKPFTRRV